MQTPTTCLVRTGDFAILTTDRAIWALVVIDRWHMDADTALQQLGAP